MTGSVLCAAESLPGKPREPSTAFTCTRAAGHPEGHAPAHVHTSCDGRGTVVAKWTDASPQPAVWMGSLIGWYQTTGRAL